MAEGTGPPERDVPLDLAVVPDVTYQSEPLDTDGSEQEVLERQAHHADPTSRIHPGRVDSDHTSAPGEKDVLEIESAAEDSSEKHFSNEEKRPELAITKSYATSNSAITRTESSVAQPPVRKPWYKNLNPGKWGDIPPVPETRQPSREYNASFFSLVYFQWIAPIMAVSLLQVLPRSIC